MVELSCYKDYNSFNVYIIPRNYPEKPFTKKKTSFNKDVRMVALWFDLPPVK